MSEANEWRGLSAATVSDALDRLGIDGQCFGIAPLDYGFRLCGRAFTVRMGPVGEAPGTVGDYIDEVAPGSVVVIDNGGRLDCTVWGDILTTMAHRRALAGTVIHGVCRDVQRSLELGYPLFTRGHYMRTGKDRVQLEELHAPVSLGSVRIEPGDLLIGDADGLIAIPAAREQQVLALAREIEQRENSIRAAIQSGARLDAARQQAGYHTLQRRKE